VARFLGDWQGGMGIPPSALFSMDNKPKLLAYLERCISMI
jgi:hypothetical protein